LATVHRALERAGLSVKQVQKMASERNKLQEGDFLQRISQYPAHYLVPLDEMSKDDRTYGRLSGRSAVGKRVEVYTPFVCKQRFMEIAALALNKGIIACRVIEGSSDRETFMDFLCNDLVNAFPWFCHVLTSVQLPVMNPYPGP
ncbi:hypothetical protein C8R44DRAFT_543689, partial [Mycena epipterygia]